MRACLAEGSCEELTERENGEMSEISPLPRGSALPPRTAWSARFPAVVTHAVVRDRDRHRDYSAAKAGDVESALTLAEALLSPQAIDELRNLVGPSGAILVPVTALETTGFNAIPDAMAQMLARSLGWPVSSGEIVQTNRVGHTRARAFNRLVTPAAFDGPVRRDGRYVLVDDHVGLGGTLANLKGHIETHGGVVVAMTTLTQSRDAHQIALRPNVLDMLWKRHGNCLETLWRVQIGHGLDRLTNVEGGILCREPSLDAIRDRLAQAAVEARGRGLDPAVAVEDQGG